MKKAPSSQKPHRNVDFLVQSVKKTLLSALVFLTIISINFLVTSCGKNEKRISVNISPPQSPNLKKQSIIPPLYISFALKHHYFNNPLSICHCNKIIIP
jgi:hypothetical protein